MNPTLAKALLALAPILILFAGAVVLYARTRTASSLVQVLGAACLIVVVLTHVCEALNLFPSMRWGAEGSIGHYVDLAGAVLGLSLFPIGYLSYAWTKQHRPAATSRSTSVSVVTSFCERVSLCKSDSQGFRC
jgi:hypothetical protein